MVLVLVLMLLLCEARKEGRIPGLEAIHHSQEGRGQQDYRRPQHQGIVDAQLLYLCNYCNLDSINYEFLYLFICSLTLSDFVLILWCSAFPPYQIPVLHPSIHPSYILAPTMSSWFKFLGPNSTNPMAKFLQSLTTGEAGFLNVCVGSSAFTFALYRHNQDLASALKQEKELAFDREYSHVLDQINETKPETLLDAIAFHRRTLASEAEAQGVKNPTKAELADEWMRRRLFPQDDLMLGVREVPDAARINEYRIQLKRMWHSIRRLHVKHPSLSMLDEDAESTNSRNEINVELSNGIARSTLLLLEPLDEALCRSRPGCVWSKDCDKIYAFIREHWNIPASWPGDGRQGPFDESFEDLGSIRGFEPHAIKPTSRVAVAMEQRKRNAELEFQVADVDGDGKVDKHEFANYLRQAQVAKKDP